MKYTQNLNLKKPEGSDIVNIQDITDNFDIIDTEIAKKVDITSLENIIEDISTELDNKVDNTNFEEHTNNTTIHVTANDKSNWNGKVNKSGDRMTGQLYLNTGFTCKLEESPSVEKIALKFYHNANDNWGGIGYISTGSPMFASFNGLGYIYDTAKDKKYCIWHEGALNIASTAEAQAGTSDTKYMSPLKVKQAIEALAGKYVIGSYIGTDYTTRAISIGFQPKLLILFGNRTLLIMLCTINKTMIVNSNPYIGEGAVTDYLNVAATGFNIVNRDINRLNISYSYLAIQ